MEVFELLETIERIIEESKNLPFSSKKVIEADELFEVVDAIKNKMPDEMKQARWIKEERTRILQEANKEAEDILKEAERRIVEMVDDHEITKKAEEQAEKIIDDATLQSRQISEGIKEYADSVLAAAEQSILDIKDTLDDQTNNMRAALSRLKDDRKELK